MPEPDNQKFQLTLEEYKSLRAEIDTRIKEAFALIIYCLTAIAAIYGTVTARSFSTPWPPNLRHLLEAVLDVTVLFPIFGAIKSLEIWQITQLIARQLRRIEAAVGIEGWETVIERARREARGSGLGGLPNLLTQPPYTLLWLFLLGLTLYVRVHYAGILPICRTLACPPG